ncbi:hypothetical protein Ahy_A04g018100 isoform A [Arachis hypogaea]|uniref:Nuclear pore complex protein Nup85 n=1 Tax=Arachis hypogaea TaxID=3818 RepID=A0A445DCY0_ARAHY|nr:hypothetical protein Ahy_A04g018100 isoform A [Arachis hypogaea]
MSSALSVGWLDIVVKMLRLHGSYQLDQLSNRELENGLVEAVAVLISKMLRLCHESTNGKLGELFKSKPDFIKVGFYHSLSSFDLFLWNEGKVCNPIHAKSNSKAFGLH